MDQWEYLTIEIALERKQYVVTFTSGRKLYGLKAILDEYDERGWEYMHMVPNVRGWAYSPRGYIAFFRRPKTTTSERAVYEE